MATLGDTPGTTEFPTGGLTLPTYTISNVTTDRAYNANSYTADELADVLGTLIADIVAGGGGGALVIATKTGAYTLTASDDVILANAASAAFTLTLPTAVGYTKPYYIKRLNSGANAVTIDPNGAQTIDGATTFVLSNQYDALTIVSDNANWVIL